ncbi:hypothetical protein B4098_2396 [Heyndrickxia coagulans]|uniref:Uncharacterized protein n=1 Tax=Heyndrickxia coagulans TaxID=1398 RepID=A0A150JPJ3_HEYCO|nr:hypothetical protein B4098_2396 [Heyndrickxia coagulans]
MRVFSLLQTSLHLARGSGPRCGKSAKKRRSATLRRFFK